MDGVVVQDDAVVTIACAVVRGGHSVTGCGRVRDQKKADLLVIACGETVGTKLCQYSICIGAELSWGASSCQPALPSDALGSMCA